MTVAYAEPRDVYDIGFSARAFVVVPRPFDPRAGDMVDAATGTFFLAGHGYADDDVLWFVQTAAGALPTDVDLVSVYYPLPLDSRRFRLAATPGGPALTFIDAGSGWALQIDPERRLRRILLSVSADIDQDLTAHATPLVAVNGRFPEKVVGVVAREAARRAVASLMFDNAAVRTAKDRVDEKYIEDKEQREAWRLGQPISPRPADQTSEPDDAARATNGIATGSIADMSWLTGTL